MNRNSIAEVRSILVVVSVLLIGQTLVLFALYWRTSKMQTAVQESSTTANRRFGTIESFMKYISDGVWMEVNPADGPTAGKEGASVSIVEFADFQCPACASLVEPLRHILDEYDGRVRLIFRHFPIVQLHPNSYAAALGGVCAQIHGKFWPYHDRLFEGQERLGREGPLYIAEVADAVGINGDEFRSCVESQETRSLLQRDLDLAGRLAVSSTPTMFVNGKRIQGAQPKLIEAAINIELRHNELSPVQ